MASGLIGQLWQPRRAVSTSDKTSHRIEPTLGTPSVAGIQSSPSTSPSPFEPRFGLSEATPPRGYPANFDGRQLATETHSSELLTHNDVLDASSPQPRDVYARPMRQIEPVDDQQEIARVRASVIQTTVAPKTPTATAFDIADAADAQSSPMGYDGLQAQPRARELKATPGFTHPHPRSNMGVSHSDAATLQKFAPSSDEPADRGVVVETFSLGKLGRTSALSPKRVAIVVGVGLIAVACWSVGTSLFSSPMTVGAGDVITITHDLTDEKVIPAASDRGGYQVPNLNVQVLQRSASNARFFSTTRAAPDPEQPLLLSGDDVAVLPAATIATASTPGDSGGNEVELAPMVSVSTMTANHDAADGAADTIATNLDLTVGAQATSQTSDNETRMLASAENVDEAATISIAIAAPKVDGLMTGTDNALQQPLQFNDPTPRTPGAMTAGALLQVGAVDAGLTLVSPSASLNGLYQDPVSPSVSFAPLAQDVIYPWGLQMGASYSADDARRIWQDLKQTNLRLLGGLRYRVEPVVQNAQSYYRLQVGPFMTRSAALDACAEMRASYVRVDCFPVTVGR